MFTVDLIIPIRQKSIFRDSGRLFQTLPVFGELWRHVTLGHISPFHHIFTFSAWRSEPPCLLGFGIQSHHCSLVLANRAIVHFPFGIQSHCSFPIWCSEPHFHFGVQSRAFSLVFRAIVHFPFGVQSHVFSLAFRAIVHFPFEVRSHICIMAFRAVVSFGVQSHRSFPIWCSEPRFQLLILLLYLYCFILFYFIFYYYFIIYLLLLFFFQLVCRLEPCSQFGVQSHYLFLVSALRATISSQFEHPEPPSLYSLVFRAVI